MPGTTSTGCRSTRGHYGRIFAWMATARTESLAELTQAFAQLKRSKPAEAYAEAAALKQRLAKLAASDPKAAQLLGEAAEHFNGNAGDLASWMPLHELLQQQSYRPAYWRVAADEINYRRFFNINDLAGVRVEQRELFEESHRLIFRMVEDGQVQGLRIDHIDGLFDPREYCDRVQARAGRPGGRRTSSSRRSSRRTNGCRPTGRSTAPPATTR